MIHTLKFRKAIVSYLLDEVAPKLLQWFFPSKHWKYSIKDYRKMPKKTLGNDIAQYLDQLQFDFLEGAEHHDARHILLGYHMNVVDEVRMQVFMVGNGKKNPFSIVLVIASIFLLPEYLKLFWKDWQRGKRSGYIAKVEWRNLLQEETISLRQQFNIQPIFFDSKLCNSKYFKDTIGMQSVESLEIGEALPSF